MSRLTPRATAPSAAGRWSAMSGNGRRRTSCRFLDLLWILTKTIRSHGLANARYCAAGVGQPADDSPAPPTGISFRRIAMTYLAASGLVRSQTRFAVQPIGSAAEFAPGSGLA